MLGKLITPLIIAAALAGSESVAAAQSRYELSAEWIGPACRLPAGFRVTLKNISDQSLYVPVTAQLGYRRAINFIAYTDAGQVSSEIFFTAPLTADFMQRRENFVVLAPGETHGFDLTFDGHLDAHGGAVQAGAQWHGDFAFYYSQPAPVEDRVEADFGPILFRDTGESVLSNRLRCP
ncbi:hypothetical protein GVN24_32460 [Rhizobium sp. CRIBSB]|nr:hypothetical protein [Rhizobium sp. CRIBSB]